MSEIKITGCEDCPFSSRREEVDHALGFKFVVGEKCRHPQKPDSIVFNVQFDGKTPPTGCPLRDGAVTIRLEEVE